MTFKALIVNPEAGVGHSTCVSWTQYQCQYSSEIEGMNITTKVDSSLPRHLHSMTSTLFPFWKPTPKEAE